MRIAQEAMPQDSSQYTNESCCLEIKIIRANFIQLRIRNKLQVEFEMMKHQQTTNHIGMNILICTRVRMIIKFYMNNIY